MKKRFYILVTALAMSVGTICAATAAKGLFSVAADKTVQFANVNSVYSDNELIRWADVDDATESGWDVLTGAEWSYLLVSGRTNANDLNALGTVNGTKGLIILPDEWVQPGTVPAFKPVDQGIAYDKNEYTAEQWAVMADAGAVFLPCGGYGYTDKEAYHVVDATDHGAYWSKDAYNSSNANCMRFNLSEIHDLNNAVKTNYYSVIMVREVVENVLDETHDAGTFEADLDAADDYGCAFVNRTLVKDGTLYTLCLPFDVPDIENSPLAGAEVFEFTGGTVSGTAGYEVLQLTMTPLAGTRLTQGVPYLLRWTNTGETLAKPLFFANVENWDDDTDAATDPGNSTVKFHGVYPKAHIPGYTSGSAAHYNFFLGANDSLYWPNDTHYAGSDMRGFRAYFYITPGGGPSPAPVRRGMQAVWKIGNSPTGIRNEGVNELKNERVKVLRDGQIILVIDGKEYNILGLKIND